MSLDDTVEDNATASIFIRSESGVVYDMNNISGKLRKQLIMEGEMSADSFSGHQNISGKRLKELREAKKEVLDLTSGETLERNTLVVGDLIKFRNIVSEVTDVDPVHGVKIIKEDGKKSKWIHHTKVQKVDVEDN